MTELLKTKEAAIAAIKALSSEFDLDKTLEIAKRIKSDGPWWSMGICSHLDVALIGVSGGDIVAICSWSWPQFSGVAAYPVPHPHPQPFQSSGSSAYSAYCDYADSRWAGEYGTLRYSLLDHIISILEAVQYDLEITGK